MLIILSTLKVPFKFFPKILVFWGVQKILEVQKYSSEAYYFDGSPQKKIAKYAQNMRKICTNMRNPEGKKSEICANMRKYA